MAEITSAQFQHFKKAARDRRLQCTLTRKQYLRLRMEVCIYCGFPSTSKNGGIDRLDSSFGYTLENSVPCCTECNMARNRNFTPCEMWIIGQAIRQIKQHRLEQGWQGLGVETELSAIKVAGWWKEQRRLKFEARKAERARQALSDED